MSELANMDNKFYWDDRDRAYYRSLSVEKIKPGTRGGDKGQIVIALRPVYRKGLEKDFINSREDELRLLSGVTSVLSLRLFEVLKEMISYRLPTWKTGRYFDLKETELLERIAVKKSYDNQSGRRLSDFESAVQERDKSVITSRRPDKILEQGGETLGVIDYYMTKTGLSFPEARKELSRICGLQEEELELRRKTAQDQNNDQIKPRTMQDKETPTGGEKVPEIGKYARLFELPQKGDLWKELSRDPEGEVALSKIPEELKTEVDKLPRELSFYSDGLPILKKDFSFRERTIYLDVESIKKRLREALTIEVPESIVQEAHKLKEIILSVRELEEKGLSARELLRSLTGEYLAPDCYPDLDEKSLLLSVFLRRHQTREQLLLNNPDYVRLVEASTKELIEKGLYGITIPPKSNS